MIFLRRNNSEENRDHTNGKDSDDEEKARRDENKIENNVCMSVTTGFCCEIQPNLELDSRQGLDMLSPRSCPICLCEFTEGDEICSSNDRRCNHAFHWSCMVMWLIEHDECPCCRLNFFDSDNYTSGDATVRSSE